MPSFSFFFFFLFFIFLHPFQKAMLSRMEKTMTLQKKKEKKIPFQGCLVIQNTTCTKSSIMQLYVHQSNTALVRDSHCLFHSLFQLLQIHRWHRFICI